jgi:AraC-like DNA-binding protein
LAFFENIETLETPYDMYLFDTDLFTLPHRAHWHYYVELLYMYEGYMTVECDNEPYVLHSGDLLIIMPKVVHSIYSSDPGRVRYGVIKFNPNELNFSSEAAPLVHAIFSGTILATQLPVYLPAAKLESYPVKSTVDQLIQELSHKDLCYADLIGSLLCTLIISVMRLWQQSGINLKSATGQNTSPSEIYTVLEYISNHSGDPIAIPDLAQQCNMSYSTFSRLFKQQTGRSCKEYIEYVRICKAQDLLLFTDQPLSYIASETGFTDCSHFIKTYKKLFGITPAQQRKSLASGLASSADIKP